MNIDGISVPFCHPPQQAIGYCQCGLLMVSRAVTDVFKHRCIAGNPIASGVAVISAIDSFYLLIAAKYSASRASFPTNKITNDVMAKPANVRMMSRHIKGTTLYLLFFIMITVDTPNNNVNMYTRASITISLSSDPISKIYEFFITQANAFAVRSPGSLK